MILFGLLEGIGKFAFGCSAKCGQRGIPIRLAVDAPLIRQDAMPGVKPLATEHVAGEERIDFHIVAVLWIRLMGFILVVECHDDFADSCLPQSGDQLLEE